MTEQSDLLTQKEAEEFLRLSPLSIWRYRKRGELPFVRFGKKLLFRRADLIAFIERNRRNVKEASQ
ncbi:MAG: helix-turn-helix domain-containing protein [Acidobacteria bacterium]|nr:helix-turn-helix domain-containing protein [Acidobacteriota bacterium]